MRVTGVRMAVLVLFVLSLAGCGGFFRHLDGSSDKDIEAFEALKASEEAQKRGAASDAEITKLQSRIAELESEQQSLNQKITEHPEGVAQAAAEQSASASPDDIAALKADLSATRERLAKLEKQINATAPATNATASAPDASVHLSTPTVALPGLRIKVLSGDGKIEAAKAMQEKVEAQGFVVERIDLAPKATFTGDFLFYQKGFESVAKNVSARLGNIKLKEMGWESIFNIIIVHVE